jgi:hypothetical protein
MYALIIDGGVTEDRAVLFDSPIEAWEWVEAHPQIERRADTTLQIVTREALLELYPDETGHDDDCECDSCVSCADCGLPACNCGGD